MGDGISRGRPFGHSKPPAPAILYRTIDGDYTEDIAACAAAAGWKGVVTPCRTSFRKYDPDHSYSEWLTTGKEPDKALVIGRYSVLPYYEETDRDLRELGHCLANSPAQHQFCADIKIWSAILAEFTPKTYTTGWDRLPEGAYVLKGATNSRKTKWNTHMFAATKADVPDVFRRLLDDSLIAPQGIVAREYIPLRKLGEGINGSLFTHEYRLFYWRDKFVAGGFYWSSFEDAENFTGVPAAARALGDKLAAIVAAGPQPVPFKLMLDSQYAPMMPEQAAKREGLIEVVSALPPIQPLPYSQFFVLDVAETAAGDWILIEVNDGQMSGLSEIEPVQFYKSLWECATAPGADQPSTVTHRV